MTFICFPEENALWSRNIMIEEMGSNILRKELRSGSTSVVMGRTDTSAWEARSQKDNFFLQA